MSRGSVGLLGAALYAHFRVASACAEHNRQYITAIKQKPETIPRFTRGKVFAEQGLRCKASHKYRVLPPLDGPGGVALSRRTDTDSLASQPEGVLRTAAGGRDPATARDRELCHSCGRTTPPGRAFGRSSPCFLARAYDSFAALSTALRLLVILRSEGCSTLSFAWYVAERVQTRVCIWAVAWHAGHCAGWSGEGGPQADGVP